MRGIIETDQPITVDTARRVAGAFKLFNKGQIDLLVLDRGMRFVPTSSAKKRIRLAESARSINRI